MKSDGEIMEILAAFDLTGPARSAAELARCSHHTVAAHVAARDAGRAVGTPARRPRNIDEFMDKVEEWVEASKGKIRADRAHEKLLALGFGGSDRTFRLVGGAPTYVLTDNEKTVTVEHVAGVPVRNRETVSFGRHYGVTVLTCQPADPASKGGVEASVKVAKADLVPTDTNLRPEYGSFAELEQACEEFMAQVNARVHRVTRRVPAGMLAEETARLHRVPDEPHTVVFGLARKVPVNTRWSPSTTASTPSRSTCSVSRCGSVPPALVPASRSS